MNALYLLAATLAMLAASSTIAAATDAGTCYTISDVDARTYCLAKAHRDSARCYSIQNPGLRSQCLADVRSQ